MDIQKSTLQTDIPTKLIKENVDLFANFLCFIFNKALDQGEFPDSLKYANITPVFKKGSRLAKENYRPVSILSNISKIFEKCMYKQMYAYIDNFLSENQCGFRKGFNTQHCLIAMVEKWREAIDKNGAFGALLTDLSKAFDCIVHDLLIAKLHALGFNLNSLNFVSNYLTNRKQRTRIENEYSEWSDIEFGVPQGSILGTLLFNIYMCDAFYIIEDIDIANFADDTTPYTSADNIDSIINILENKSKVLFE